MVVAVMVEVAVVVSLARVVGKGGHEGSGQGGCKGGGRGVVIFD